MLGSLVDEIEMFRRDYNELPETLVEIGVPSRGRWTYAVLGEERLHAARQLMQGRGI